MRRRLMALVLLPGLLAGCANAVMRPTMDLKPKVERLEPLTMPSNAIGMETRNDDVGSDVISTQSRSDLMPTAFDNSDPLPSYVVPRMSFSGTPLQDVLQAVIRDTGVAMSVVWDNQASKISRSSASMSHLGGDLSSVLNKLADSYGFYWRFKDGMLYITADRQYITPVPPVADLFESLPIMVKTLGGTDVFLDKSARLITFRADSQSFFKIKSYLDITRKNRSLIVYDTYIWEVILNDASKMGVDWGALAGSGAGAGTTMLPTTSLTLGPSSALASATKLLTAGLVNAASGGTGLALSFAGSRFSMNLLIDFLRSQGTVNSLSQPKIQLLSGGRATLRDEIATTYVSRISSSSVSAGTVIPGSVETSQVKTGMTLEVSGDVSDGTIYSDIALRVSDLLGMGSTVVSGNTITLPQTASREVNTHVRAKPGDTILLAGIQYDKVNGAINSGMGIVRSNQSDVMRSELIIVMRPRIKHFVADNVSAAPTPPVAAVPPPVMAAPILVAPAVLPPLVLAAPPQPQPVPNIEAVAAPTPAPTLPLITDTAAETMAPHSRQAPSADADMPRGIYVQHGAFGQLANAESVRLALFQQLGWRSDEGERVHVLAPNKQSKLHRVVVGPFDKLKDAEQWAERGRRILGSPLLLLTL